MPNAPRRDRAPPLSGWGIEIDHPRGAVTDVKRGHGIVDHVLHAVQECCTGTGTTLVGIDGPGGAGKSILAASLARKDSRTSVVPIDDFHVPRDRRVRGRDAVLTPWKNIEVSRLLQEVLQPLAARKEGGYRRYDWGSDALAERRVIPAGGLVFVEGVYALIAPLTGYYQFKVWMDCPAMDRRLLLSGEMSGCRRKTGTPRHNALWTSPTFCWTGSVQSLEVRLWFSSSKQRRCDQAEA